MHVQRLLPRLRLSLVDPGPKGGHFGAFLFFSSETCLGRFCRSILAHTGRSHVNLPPFQFGYRH